MSRCAYIVYGALQGKPQWLSNSPADPCPPCAHTFQPPGRVTKQRLAGVEPWRRAHRSGITGHSRVPGDKGAV